MPTVIDALENFPSEIGRREKNVAAARAALDYAKLNLELEEAKATIEYAPTAKNQTVLAAMVTANPVVQEARKAVVKATENMKLVEAQFHSGENVFNAARRLSNLQLTSNEILDLLDG